MTLLPLSRTFQCSRTCGKGIQQRHVNCRHEDGQYLDEEQCSLEEKPQNTQTCKFRSCRKKQRRWKKQKWSEVRWPNYLTTSSDKMSSHLLNMYKLFLLPFVAKENCSSWEISFQDDITFLILTLRNEVYSKSSDEKKSRLCVVWRDNIVGELI